MLLPIIMICVCALLGGGTLIFLKLSAKHKKSKNKDKEELAQITANEFVNVKDIRGNFLYTRDNLALAYLKIYPISTELFSKNEKRLIAKQLTVSLSSAQYPFQLLAVSRPVDISPLLSELSATLTSSSDVKQKELLKQEIVEMGAFALSGEVVERQFYIKIWDRVSDGVERDLLQKLKLLGGYFSDSGIQTEILQQQDIVRLCNLVNNPAYEIPVFHKALSECGSLEVRPVAICVPQEIQEYCMELFGEDVQVAAASHDLFAKRANGQIYRPLVEKYIAGEKRL